MSVCKKLFYLSLSTTDLLSVRVTNLQVPLFYQTQLHAVHLTALQGALKADYCLRPGQQGLEFGAKNILGYFLLLVLPFLSFCL